MLLVHVVRPVSQEITYFTPAGGWLPTPAPVVNAAQDLIAYERAVALQQLQHAASQLRALGVPTVRVAVVEGSPDDAIVALARREQCDLIVIATRGQSGFRRMMHGSVAEGVVVHGRQPVLIVGPVHSATA